MAEKSFLITFNNDKEVIIDQYGLDDAIGLSVIYSDSYEIKEFDVQKLDIKHLKKKNRKMNKDKSEIDTEGESEGESVVDLSSVKTSDLQAELERRKRATILFSKLV